MTTEDVRLRLGTKLESAFVAGARMVHRHVPARSDGSRMSKPRVGRLASQ